MRAVWQHLDHIESYICRALLAVFVTLLFVQIVARQVFGTSITWIEELSVILFVWFAYFGASYAARMSAHNRVTFHIRMLPGPRAGWSRPWATPSGSCSTSSSSGSRSGTSAR